MEIRIKKPKLNVETGILGTLIKKELLNYFSTPLAYVVMLLFIIVIAILFFAVGKYLQYGTGDLTILFSYISFAFVIIVPALTMSSISKEKQSGTIEYMLTQPITEVQFLMSKFLSYSILIFLLLLLTLPIVLIVGTFTQLDVGQVAMQYVGAWILGISLVSVGLAVSALFKNEIAAFLTTLVISAILIVLGSELVQTTLGFDFILERLGLLSHYQSISRGVLDFRDVLYFLAFIFAFLSIAYFLIIRDKFPKTHKYLRNAQIALVVLIVITLLIGYIGQLIPGRIDFTSNKLYTLSDSSVDLVQQAKDNISVRFYASSNLPAQFQSRIRNVLDLLRDYSNYSQGKLSVEYIQPNINEEKAKEAEDDGLQPIQFQISTTDSAQLTVGYFGIVLNYLDKKEVINLSDEQILNNLEYQITKKIKKLTNTDPKTIAFAKEKVGYTLANNFGTLSTELNELFNVTEISLDESIPEEVDAIIIAGVNEEISKEAVDRLKVFFDNGGSIFLMADPVQASEQTGSATVNKNSLAGLFSEYGVSVNEDLVYDLENNNLIRANYFFPVNYPFWVLAQSTGADTPILREVNTISYLWGSSLSVNKNDKAKVVELIKTSSASNIQKPGSIQLAVDQTWNTKDDDKERILSVSIENQKGGRAVVVGDAKLLSDQFNMVTYNENLAFGLGSIEWLSKEDSISGIKAKVRTPPLLNLQQSQISLLTFAGVGIPLVVIIGAGVVKFFQRKRKLNKTYQA